ncbi:hypothetical protein [Ruegeria jejuensis]|uniref:hypothetical protein n=1 Tax=Ruegeria jejuensis TaxID=3233338 RepID=UPI00355ADC61
MGERLTVDLLELMRLAFIEGFKASGEGYNGEYPFDYCDSRISRELSEDAERSVSEILSALRAEQIDTPAPAHTGGTAHG